MTTRHQRLCGLRDPQERLSGLYCGSFLDSGRPGFPLPNSVRNPPDIRVVGRRLQFTGMGMPRPTQRLPASRRGDDVCRDQSVDSELRRRELGLS